ncbi:MAG: hypothetical protein OXI01_02495 [Albidovulum sp.]|nr:hypothetical protein [Albidovulum sp.]
MDSLRLQAGPDQMRRMVGQSRDEEVRADPPVQLVEEGPEPELRFQRAESGFDFRLSPALPQDRFGVPAGSLGPQDAGAARLVRLGVPAAALEPDRDGAGAPVVADDLDRVVPGHLRMLLLEAADALQDPVAALHAALDREALVQLRQARLESLPLQGRDGVFLALPALAGDAGLASPPSFSRSHAFAPSPAAISASASGHPFGAGGMLPQSK